MSPRLEVLGALILCASLAALAFFVLAHNPRASLNRRFALSSIAIGGWTLTIPAALSASDLHHTVILGRLGFAFASAIPFTLLWFISAFSPQHERPSRLSFSILLPAAGCVFFIAASLSPLIVPSAARGSSKANFVYGPLHPAFGAYFLLCFLHAAHTLWRTMRRTSGLRRLQLRYLLLGILLGGTGAITTNLLIPLVAKTSRYSALGPYFSLVLLSFAAHAIIRYRLMDVRVVIRNGVVYVFAIVATATIFWTFVDVAKRLAAYDKNSIPVTDAFVVALLLAILFQPLKTWLQRSLNRYVYREPYDYQRTIRDASRRLSTLLDLTSLLNYLAAAIERTFKTEGVAVYLRDPDSPRFLLRTPTTPDVYATASQPPWIEPSSPLATFLATTRRVLVREEATQLASDDLLLPAARALDSLHGDVAIPIIYDSSIAGFLIAPRKRSGDPYFSQDLELLETLVGQASVAMRNAQLYREVVLIKEYVNNILATMDSGVVAVDASGNISLFNPAAERLTGLLHKDLRGANLHTLPPALASPLSDTLRTNLARSQFELTIPGPHGPVPLVASTAPLRATDEPSASPPQGALIVFSNLTRLKELEREKRRSERLASFGALASGVAHEIKNPLVAIRTFAELLPERYADEEFRDGFSKVVIREIARIDHLVARLRGIAASNPPRAGRTDLREPIRDTLALLRAQLEHSRTVVHCHFDDPAPFVSVDESQLKQLFLNLLLNALEAMGPDGTVTLHVFRKQVHGASWVTATVTDTGPGIPEAVRAHVFDPFFTTKPTGSGLGLAICRSITDAHRGAIRVEPAPSGAGTTIVVEFPACDDAATSFEQEPLTTASD